MKTREKSTSHHRWRLIIYALYCYTKANVIPVEQFRSRAHRSVVHQACPQTYSMPLTNTRASDKFWIDSLIVKCIRLGLTEDLTVLIKSFLLVRSIKVKKTLSSCELINAGALQGSGLAPALFNLFLRDVPKREHVDVAFETDDTASKTSCLNFAGCKSTLRNSEPSCFLNGIVYQLSSRRINYWHGTDRLYRIELIVELEVSSRALCHQIDNDLIRIPLIWTRPI
ncbi:uncharacterized protein LOC143203170 [Rhynchophorus ferrugineus]|uniref:uncharacterized protein LOC143203170 n=1 Tax=Rhynchophorus ferrugineus TaxID=354439 RepID=UPI003FCE9AA2